MTEEEFNTAITMMRNKYQSRISIAKSFLTPEQWHVYRSKPFVAERNDKPRWDFGKENKQRSVRRISRRDIGHIDLPLAGNQIVGKVDWTYHSRVTMAQILRILNGDYRPRVREVQPRKGYVWYDDKAQVV